MENNTNSQKLSELGRTPTFSKDDIDFSRIINIEGDKENIKLAKIVIQSKETSRRVEEKCDVKFYIQKYICSLEDKSFKHINKDYKNIYKRSIEKIASHESILRKCLLTLYDEQCVWIIIHKDADPEQYKSVIRDLKIEDQSKIEEFLYYKIIIESIVFPQPAEPKSLHLYDKYIKKFQDEIRYFISKENYLEGEKWANSIINKFFNMNKQLKSQMTNELNKKLLPMMKSIVLNKTLCILKKPNVNNKHNDYNEIILTITKDYYKNFVGDKDDKYFKITLRLAHCYYELKNQELFESTLNELKQVNDKDENLIKMFKDLDTWRNKSKTKQKKLIDYFKQTSYGLEENAYTWDTVRETLDLSSNIDVNFLTI